MGKNTYVAVGNKEDMSPLIVNISPEDTPITQAIGKGGGAATARIHSWIEDSLPDPQANKLVEGAEFSVADPPIREELYNYTQIMGRGYQVSGSQEATLKHGLTSEMAYQMRKAMVALSLDIEKAIIEQEVAVQGDAGTPREMGGIPYFIVTNNLTAEADRLITEDLVNDAMQACWNEGGKPSILVVSGGNKRIVSKWTTNTERVFPIADTKLIRKIDVYESDFGLLKIVANRWMPNNRAYILDTNYWGLSWFRPFKKMVLPQTGDNHKEFIYGELTMEGKAEQGSAMISNLALTVESGE